MNKVYEKLETESSAGDIRPQGRPRLRRCSHTLVCSAAPDLFPF